MFVLDFNIELLIKGLFVDISHE